ncbi:MAG TPA: hypothetical protein VFV07_02395 [Rhizomicrobium sp.]|nr:hypothetical protein [Rhizomicrobium sp.]
MRYLKTAACAALLALAATAVSTMPAASQTMAEILNPNASSAPTPPSGLKVTCLVNPNSLQSAKTCPVVHYMGMTTWAYSYIDNRVSLALVTYDGSGKIVRNVEQPGTRYVWNMTSSLTNKNITIFGQSNAYVELPWAKFGP